MVPSLALHDTMRYLKSDVGTIGFGACMGMSGFLLATGTKGKRAVLPNTRVMLHHPSGVARGQAADIDNEARGEKRRRVFFCFDLFSFSLRRFVLCFCCVFSHRRALDRYERGVAREREKQRKKARESSSKREGKKS